MKLSNDIEVRCQQLEDLGFDVINTESLYSKITVSISSITFIVDNSFINTEDVMDQLISSCFKKGFTEGSNSVKRQLKELVTVSGED